VDGVVGGRGDEAVLCSNVASSKAHSYYTYEVYTPSWMYSCQSDYGVYTPIGMYSCKEGCQDEEHNHRGGYYITK
jgi:hypothetical protein